MTCGVGVREFPKTGECSSLGFRPVGQNSSAIAPSMMVWEGIRRVLEIIWLQFSGSEDQAHA